MFTFHVKISVVLEAQQIHQSSLDVDVDLQGTTQVLEAKNSTFVKYSLFALKSSVVAQGLGTTNTLN